MKIKSSGTRWINLFLGLIFSFFLSLPAVFALSDLPPVTNSDRILILAPHPDDETIAAAGVIQKAVAANAKVKIILLTNGENNLRSFMVYDNRFFFGPKRIIRMGMMRRQESVNAMKKLGLSENDIVSLGYPDDGTLEILTKRWADAKPFEGEFSHAKQVPYADAASPNSPYSGESILKDIEKILLEYRPTKIFVSHPNDANADHQAFYLFMRVALWNLEEQINLPEIYTYLIHGNDWPLPEGYQPELEISVPHASTKGFWQHLQLGSDEVLTKYKALQSYPSQIEYAPNRLVSFVRKNELFETQTNVKAGEENSEAFTYSQQGDRLLIKIKLNRKIRLWTKVSVFLLGYKKNYAFQSMPKIELTIRMNRLAIKDKKEKIVNENIKFSKSGNDLFLSIPISLLGNPDFILSEVKTKPINLLENASGWKVLELNQFVE